MELFEAIFARRSYRGMYKADPVPREDLKKIAEAALAAPSRPPASSPWMILL